jgi:2-keto-3-deoxy-L-rhamnonate aldolase RhmA
VPQSDIVRNTVAEKLARGELVSSMTVRLVQSVEIARIARTAGFDSLYVDLEHSSFSFNTASQICSAALDAEITPFVRVPSTRPDHVARALDGGALGVIAPHIRVMVETRAALENVEEIASVDGIDLLLVGTNDLSGDLGIPGEYSHEKIRDAFRRTIAACRANGKFAGVGGLASQPALAATFAELGARYVSTATDLGFLLAAATEKARQVAAMSTSAKPGSTNVAERRDFRS